MIENYLNSYIYFMWFKKMSASNDIKYDLTLEFRLTIVPII